MAKIVSATAHMKPTAYGKRMIAMATYKKGTSFVAAAILLNRHGGDASAVLHVLCQGIEVLMKGILLVVDYDKLSLGRSFGRWGMTSSKRRKLL